MGLFAAAVATDFATRISGAQLRSASPRRYPIAWFAFGSVGVAGVVGLVWATVWLAAPLFDSGTELNEALAFQVPGLEQPEDVQRAAIVAVTDALATPSEQASIAAPSQSSGAPAEGAAAPESGGEGFLISSGNLQGADALHTGSGEVLLVQGPDGEVILRFQDYEVRNGPDLRIYLSPDPGGGVRADGTISLGGIKATSGFVNYDVPVGVDPSIFRSVIIYCEPFGIVFATASLSPAGGAVPASTEAPASASGGQGQLIASGNLQRSDAFHTGSGEVLLVQGPDGEVILRFQDYEVRNGPDLRIYLSPDPGGDVNAAGAISLGRVKATSGSVNYDVPADVDPTIFRSVIVYCEPFGVVFATAVIG